MFKSALGIYRRNAWVIHTTAVMLGVIALFQNCGRQVLNNSGLSSGMRFVNPSATIIVGSTTPIQFTVQHDGCSTTPVCGPFTPTVGSVSGPFSVSSSSFTCTYAPLATATGGTIVTLRASCGSASASAMIAYVGTAGGGGGGGGGNAGGSLAFMPDPDDYPHLVGGSFGASIDSHNDLVIVGAPNAKATVATANGAGGYGAFMILRRDPTSGWVIEFDSKDYFISPIQYPSLWPNGQAKPIPFLPPRNSGDRMGESVAIAGSSAGGAIAVVGVPGADGPFSSPGYLQQTSGTDIGMVVILKRSAGANGGWSLFQYRPYQVEAHGSWDARRVGGACQFGRRVAIEKRTFSVDQPADYPMILSSFDRTAGSAGDMGALVLRYIPPTGNQGNFWGGEFYHDEQYLLQPRANIPGGAMNPSEQIEGMAITRSWVALGVPARQAAINNVNYQRGGVYLYYRRRAPAVAHAFQDEAGYFGGQRDNTEHHRQHDGAILDNSIVIDHSRFGERISSIRRSPQAVNPGELEDSVQNRILISAPRRPSGVIINAGDIKQFAVNVTYNPSDSYVSATTPSADPLSMLAVNLNPPAVQGGDNLGNRGFAAIREDTGETRVFASSYFHSYGLNPADPQLASAGAVFRWGAQGITKGVEASGTRAVSRQFGFGLSFYYEDATNKGILIGAPATNQTMGMGTFYYLQD